MTGKLLCGSCDADRRASASTSRENVMKLSTLLLGAAAIGLLSTSVSFADDYVNGAVKSAMVGGKEILTDAKGMTLYTWDKDTQGTAGAAAVSNCNDQCATNWPPAMAAAGATATADFTLVTRKDGTVMWAYKGWPLYTWIKDTKPGDTTGDGVGGTWHTAIDAD
jgi:predicted lipoprotein with Yx(FWY)xxD motif